jgi:trypsin
MALRFIVLSLCIVGSLAVPTPLRIDPALSWRVVGGGPAPEGTYPYIISLQYNGRHNCGGSIVSKNYVITAAHCVDGTSASSLTVKTGINKLSNPGNVYKVLKINQHEDYDSWTIFNDVAILQVEDIDTSLPKVSTIRAETEFVEGGEPLALAGWGSTTLGGGTPDDLQQILLAAISVKACQDAQGQSNIRDTQICTLTKAGEGACHGDSGGPLLRRVDDHERLVGIVSWGTPCARGKPDVFGRVSAFVPWFNSKCIDQCRGHEATR